MPTVIFDSQAIAATEINQIGNRYASAHLGDGSNHTERDSALVTYAVRGPVHPAVDFSLAKSGHGVNQQEPSLSG